MGNVGRLLVKVAGVLLAWLGGATIAVAIAQPVMNIYVGATLIYVAWLLLRGLTHTPARHHARAARHARAKTGKESSR